MSLDAALLGFAAALLLAFLAYKLQNTALVELFKEEFKAKPKGKKISRQDLSALVATVPAHRSAIGTVIVALPEAFIFRDVDEPKKILQALAWDLYELTNISTDGLVLSQSTYDMVTAQAHLEKAFKELSAYGTPLHTVGSELLIPLANIPTPRRVPMMYRRAHTHLIAGTNHGKTQTLQEWISKDLPAVARGQRSIVVIDSQDVIIPLLSRLKFFVEHPQRLVLIDPRDPLALNPFDLGSGGKSAHVLRFIIDSIFENSTFTDKQNIIFNFVVPLLAVIPNATIHTFINILDNGVEEYGEYVDRLSPTAQTFLREEFNNAQYKETRPETARRLWSIMSNPIFDQMFSQPKTRFNIAEKMDKGCVILIDTSHDHFEDDIYSSIFGAFFIGLIYQAIRARGSQANPTDCIVYIDEAHEYFAQTAAALPKILRQSRKRHVGFVLAHQDLGQAKGDLFDALAGTAIKFAGGLISEDVKPMSAQLRCDPDFLKGMSEQGHYAVLVRGFTRVPEKYVTTPHIIESMPSMTEDEYQAMRRRMRQMYGRTSKQSALIVTEAVPAAETPPSNQKKKRKKSKLSTTPEEYS